MLTCDPLVDIVHPDKLATAQGPGPAVMMNKKTWTQSQTMHKNLSQLNICQPESDLFTGQSLPKALDMLVPCFQGEAGEEIPAFLKESPAGFAEKLMDAEALGKMDHISLCTQADEVGPCRQSSGPLQFGRLLSGFFSCRRECDSSAGCDPQLQSSSTAMTVFSNFRHNLPEGLVIGCGRQPYAIRPGSVIVKDFAGASGATREISFSFHIKYSDGLQGIARYIDRFKDGDRVELFREYSDRSVVTSSFYRDHQKTHDLYRTLMSQIIQGEISLTYYGRAANDQGLNRLASG